MSYENLVGLNVIDEQGYQQYRAAMMPILKSFGGYFGYDFMVSEVLLSQTTNDINRVFTIGFPDKNAMEKFFSDPEYLEVKKRHFENSVATTTRISGYDKL